MITNISPLIKFILNDQSVSTDLPPGMVLVDFIRYYQNLTGTKIGCREGDCGACTVLVGSLNGEQNMDYISMTSCLMPLANAHEKHIVTIEGINLPDKLNPVQQAMYDEGATQCGFCTPGFVMSLAGFCLNGKENAVAAVDGNICRCTGYKSIERAAKKIEVLMQSRQNEDVLSFISRNNILPSYFSDIGKRLVLLSKSNADQSADFPITTGKQENILGGGTDLYVQKHQEMVHAMSRFVFNEVELNSIKKEGNNCIIGASATVTDLKESEIFNNAIPGFNRFAKLVSSTPIRNMATIAGNFVNASPIGDMTIMFLALDAKITLIPSDAVEANGNSRTIPLREFYKGYKQLAKDPNEIIFNISFEIPGPNDHFSFEKVSKRTHLDIATVNSAILVKNDEQNPGSVSVSAGGVGPIPLFLKKTSAFLSGKNIHDDLIDQAVEIMKTEISPISDVRGSKEYKTLLAGQLFRAHFTK